MRLYHFPEAYDESTDNSASSSIEAAQSVAAGASIVQHVQEFEFASHTHSITASSRGLGASVPPSFEENKIYPAGRHLHDFFDFLKNPVDYAGRSPGDPDYDRRTIKVLVNEYARFGRDMNGVDKQWWHFKKQYYDTVILFRSGMS